AGYYTTMATKAGCIGMTGTNARPSVAPTFSVEGMFGTNPFTLGVPTDEEFDFNFDCATSITQNGKVEYYERIGEDIHPGTVIDSEGNPVEGDAGVALKKIRQGTAALTTLGGIGEALGGYKGYGFAMFVEFLSSILQDGAYGKDLDGKDENGNIRPYQLGHFFIAIDTNHFMGEEIARKKAGDIIRGVRAAKKAPGEDRIYTAGEKEYDIWCQRKDSGVPINESVQAEMNKVRDDLGLDYKFPWEA
ncbi:MAG: Ldh family oxidoreductase, partial [Clostridia bacterium]|nr:Ldh family oxidoreductase [Clostridia bacterium]